MVSTFSCPVLFKFLNVFSCFKFLILILYLNVSRLRSKILIRAFPLKGCH